MERRVAFLTQIGNVYNRFAKTPSFQDGGVGKARFQADLSMDGKAVESLERKTPSFQDREAYSDGVRRVPAAIDLIHRVVREKSFNGTPHVGAGLIAAECHENGWDIDIFSLYGIAREMRGIIENYPLIMMSAIDMGVTAIEKVLIDYPELNGRTIIGGQGISPVADEFSERHPGVAVFSGRADFEVSEVLSRFESGVDMSGVLRRTRPVDLSEYDAHPSIDEDFTHHAMKAFNRTRIKPIEVTSGCTQNCEFCPTAGESVTVKPFDVVKREIEMMGLRRTDILFFVDHNLFNLQRDYLKGLFDYINTKGILWSGDGTIAQVADDEDLIKTMAKGCIAFLAGLEDINGDYEGSPVKARLVRDFDDILATLRRNKFPVTWSMVFGLDSHTRETFLETANFIEKRGLNVNLHLIQPRNGSAFQSQLIKEDRMYIDDSRYRDGVHLVYEPKHMTRDQVLGGYIWLKRFVARTVKARFLNNLGIGGLRYAASLASIEIAADALTYLRMREMYPELVDVIEAYEADTI